MSSAAYLPGAWGKQACAGRRAREFNSVLRWMAAAGGAGFRLVTITHAAGGPITPRRTRACSEQDSNQLSGLPVAFMRARHCV